MNRFPYSAKVLFFGLCTAQVIATIQVYLSNIELYHALVAIGDAGYVPVPNQRIMSTLREFGPAFFGGLFFTFTVGAGLSVLTLAAFSLWHRLLPQNKFALCLLVLLWLGCLAAVNSRGVSPVVSAYFLVIPLVVVVAALRLKPQEYTKTPWLHRMVQTVPLVTLALVWTVQIDSRLFLDLRDNLLLSNPLGRALNDFYYTYTLYPAEAFKSLEQKTLKTCSLDDVQEQSLTARLQRELLNNDYLPVGMVLPVDLKISQVENSLVFEHKGRVMLRVTPRDFFSHPEALLKEISRNSDRHAFFRTFTYFCLLLAFPFTVYLVLHALINLVVSSALEARDSSVLASILCFLVGIAVLVPFHLSRGERVGADDPAKALQSERPLERVAALKVIANEGMEVGALRAYGRMPASPHVPERYWLARALGVSRRDETYRDLLDLLDDPHANVVSMAYYALGQRGERNAVKEILTRMQTSDHWYNQWYAYKALRALGWTQTTSN